MFYSNIMGLPFFQSKSGKMFKPKLSQESTTYNAYYYYWFEQLFERVMRLFVWTIPDELNLPAKEIEQRLLIDGKCAISKYDGELTAFFCSFFEPTKYLDEWKKITVRCPIYAGTRTLGVDAIVIDNTSLRNNTVELMHHYATLLAHCEVTLVGALVDSRDSGGVPVAGNEKTKQSVTQYLARKYNGQFGTITDASNIGLEMVGVNRGTKQSVKDIMEVRSALLKGFYSDIGVRSAFEKNNNAVEAEVISDTSLLLLNLSDMLECRKRGADKVNEMFGTSISVEIAKEIDYGTENEMEGVSYGTQAESE